MGIPSGGILAPSPAGLSAATSTDDCLSRVTSRHASPFRRQYGNSPSQAGGSVRSPVHTAMLPVMPRSPSGSAIPPKNHFSSMPPRRVRDVLADKSDVPAAGFEPVPLGRASSCRTPTRPRSLSPHRGGHGNPTLQDMKGGARRNGDLRERLVSATRKRRACRSFRVIPATLPVPLVAPRRAVSSASQHNRCGRRTVLERYQPGSNREAISG
jgi:hypothetical protein